MNEQALVNRPQIQISATIDEAWRRVSGTRGAYWMGILYQILISLGLLAAAALLGKILGTELAFYGDVIFNDVIGSVVSVVLSRDSRISSFLFSMNRPTLPKS